MSFPYLILYFSTLNKFLSFGSAVAVETFGGMDQKMEDLWPLATLSFFASQIKFQKGINIVLYVVANIKKKNNLVRQPENMEKT